MKSGKPSRRRCVWDEIPLDIQEKMLENQVSQGQKEDPSVFVSDISNGISNGGFNWDDSLEGFPFWAKVIGDSRLPLEQRVEWFRSRYPLPPYEIF